MVERVLFERPGDRLPGAAGHAPVGERDLVVVVGTLPPAEPGELIRAEGAWYDDRELGSPVPRHRRELEAPASEAGLVAYLGSGRIKGVGEELARRLVGHVRRPAGRGDRARAAAAARRRGGRAQAARSRLQEAWQGQRRARDTLVFLAEQGFSRGRANRILEAYGADAVATISDDPYALARDIRGIGFATADQVALKLGVAPDSVQRIGAAMAEVLREAADDGHTALPLAEARTPARRELLAALARSRGRRRSSASAGPAGWSSSPTASGAI